MQQLQLDRYLNTVHGQCSSTGRVTPWPGRYDKILGQGPGSELREEQHKAHLWHQLQPAAAAATVNFYPSFFHIWMQLGAILASIMQLTDARSSYVDFSEL